MEVIILIQNSIVLVRGGFWNHGILQDQIALFRQAKLIAMMFFVVVGMILGTNILTGKQSIVLVVVLIIKPVRVNAALDLLETGRGSGRCSGGQDLCLNSSRSRSTGSRFGGGAAPPTIIR